MSKSEFWSWVHLYYGDELGLTSDDDDYMPVTPEDKSKFQAYLQNELGQSQEGTVIEIAKVREFTWMSCKISCLPAFHELFMMQWDMLL